MIRTSSLKVALAIILKDVQTEFRSRELLSSMALFALLSILVFSFALELDRTARAEAISGVLWVTVVFASILGLNRSLAMERDQGNIDAMLIAPIARTAIFLGKLVGSFIFSLVVGLLLIPLMTVLYNLTLVNGWLLVVLVLGTLGFSTFGTLLATMTVQTRSRETLLPIVMLPLALPVLLAVVKASTGILNNAAADDWMAWVQILLAVNVVYFVVCFLMFDYIIEE
jgi:heme exporter protein B